MPDEQRSPEDATTYTVTEDQSITRPDGAVIGLKKGDEIPMSHARELGLVSDEAAAADDEAADENEDGDAEPPQ